MFAGRRWPKKVYSRFGESWTLIDEFSGYLMTTDNNLPKSYMKNEIITVDDFIKSL